MPVGFAEFFALLVGAGHILFASLVSAHVLLSHQNVRSSIGWIGLAWLSPFIGSSIYVAFGINRVQRRASALKIQHRVSISRYRNAGDVLAEHLPSNIGKIARMGDAMTGMPLREGNGAAFLRNGAEAYPAMIGAIETAQKSIALSSYIFADDAAGEPIVGALKRARARGVLVRVMVDGVGSGYLRTPILKKLKEADLVATRFLHEMLPWQMPFINLRNHKKLLIVDGKVGFTGGLNISADNLNHDGQPRVRDVHVRLDGPIVEQLMLNFATDWEFATGESLEGPEWWPPLETVGETAMRGISSGPDDTRGRVETTFLGAIEQAQRSVRILTPYFLPEDHVLDTLNRAALRGVSVDVIVPEKSNHWYFNWAMNAQLATAPLDRLNVWQARPPFDHSKLMSVDGVWSAFGSANWDARSMRLNFEFLVECYGTETAAQINAIIDDKKQKAVRLTHDRLSRRSLPAKLRDGAVRLLLPYL